MNTSDDPIKRANAIATLSTIVSRGDTVYLIRRSTNRHARNKVVDLRLASAPTRSTAGELIGVMFSKVYLFHRSGLLLKKDEAAEDIVRALSVELFGEPNQLQAVWL